MDKGSFFFAMKCGSCHPGDQALKYDRDGYPFYSNGKFGYEQAIDDGKYTGPIVRSGSPGSYTYANVTLDGDYGWVVPQTRLSGTAAPVNRAAKAPWDTAGAVEANCMLCHANLMGLPGRLDQYGNNFGWMDRSATLGAKKFSWSASATMGWTNAVQCYRGDPNCDPFPLSQYAEDMMPMNFPPTLANGTGSTPALAIAYTDGSGNLKPGLKEVDDGTGNLVLAMDPIAILEAPSDFNCQGCHAFPDIKKSGKIWMSQAQMAGVYGGDPSNYPKMDAHVGEIGCVTCHPSQDGVGHNFAKGDTGVTGTVRDDLDYVGMKTCTNCHLEGGSAGAPDPGHPHTGSVAAANHTTIPSTHFQKIACQGCHIPYARWGFHPTMTFGAASSNPGKPMPMITDAVYDMGTNGTQLMYPWAGFMGIDPLRGVDALATGYGVYRMGDDPTSYASRVSDTDPAKKDLYKWYPTVYNLKGKLTTGKMALTAYFGEWNGVTGDLAIVAPYPLRLVRKALTGGYGGYASRTVGNPANNPFSISEIQAALVALKNAVDVDTTTTYATNPVLAKAGLVYHLDASDNVQSFVSSVAESPAFGVGHSVAPLKTSAADMMNDGPLGTGGCTDCHSPSSRFFYGQKLADFKDATTGYPVYYEQYKLMGYTDARVAQLAGAYLTVSQVNGTGTVVSDVGGKTYTADGSLDTATQAIDCSGAANAVCTADFSPPAFDRKSMQAVTLTATPPTGHQVQSWTGCATVSADKSQCSVTMDASKTVSVQYGP